jgi:hypothetical protein
MTPERRRLGQTRTRETVQQLTAPREQNRAARLYAQQWYVALRAWDVREVKIPYSFHYDTDESGPELLTAASGARKPTRYLQTPAGEYTEGEVGAIITQMTLSGTVEAVQLGKMLDRLRHERNTCMIGLLREDGRWERNREAASRYAVAVLTLAVRLRVQEAEQPLALMQLALRGQD